MSVPYFYFLQIDDIQQFRDPIPTPPSQPPSGLYLPLLALLSCQNEAQYNEIRERELTERAVTPGNSFPSSNSRDLNAIILALIRQKIRWFPLTYAPPPVDTWLNWSSTPYFLATVAVSPPPIITVLPFLTPSTAMSSLGYRQ